MKLEKLRKVRSNSPRTQILFLLRKSERGLSTEELCRALQVTPMAVHRQLKRLLQEGLVKSETLRQTRGRPLHIYKLTEATDPLFPKSYSQLLLELLTELKVKQGAARVRELFESRFKKFVARHKETVSKRTASDTVVACCDVLNENSYMAESNTVSGDKFVIKLHNCPIYQVARQFPEICGCEQASLGELLEAKVTRDRHILQGHNYCSYLVEKK
jgi:predicted ArsR family transcriptional regulator